MFNLSAPKGVIRISFSLTAHELEMEDSSIGFVKKMKFDSDALCYEQKIKFDCLLSMRIFS